MAFFFKFVGLSVIAKQLLKMSKLLSVGVL
jgi:hypothetical protein